MILQGRSIAPGIAIGIAWLEELPLAVPKYHISTAIIKEEKDRFRYALHIVQRDLELHIKSAHGNLNDDLNQVLKAHEMMLHDSEVLERIESSISLELKNAEWAVSDEIERLISRFEGMRDPYLQARAEDFRDLGSNTLKALSEKPDQNQIEIEEGLPIVMITRNLFPSLAMKAHKEEVVGFATESPAISSHAAIILKSLDMPVVGHVENMLKEVRNGDEIIVDGINGLVIVGPEEATQESYRRLSQEQRQKPPGGDYRTVSVFTQDGLAVELMANIEHPNQVFHFLRHKLEGIGLFRTEFLALERGFVPNENEQFLAYRSLIESVGGLPVIIRTFDIGADKSTAGLHRCTGMNPALGVRGIRRHLLREPEELRVQIKAILRAALNAQVGVLFPMITDLNDIRKAKEHLSAAKDELEKENVPFAKDTRIGAMIEVPSAAILTSEILMEADFISIGTNDLLQYFTGADRDNPEVLYYHDPSSSAFGWLLKYIITEARELGRENDVTVCGEIAANSEIVPLLLEMGFRSLSISPVYADSIRSCISKISINKGGL